MSPPVGRVGGVRVWSLLPLRQRSLEQSLCCTGPRKPGGRSLRLSFRVWVEGFIDRMNPRGGTSQGWYVYTSFASPVQGQRATTPPSRKNDLKTRTVSAVIKAHKTRKKCTDINRNLPKERMNHYLVM